MHHRFSLTAMLLPLFQVFENSPLGQTIRGSTWLFPVIESFHLVGLTVIGGAILIVDMRLMGLGLRGHRVAHLARDLQPWLVASLALMLITGLLLFVSEAVKCYYSSAFWWKMTFLFLAITYTFTIRRRVTAAEESSVDPYWRRLAGVVSLVLWSGVGIGGRWIGFS
jgi:hypothetical protein